MPAFIATFANPIPPQPHISNRAQGYSEYGTRLALDLIVFDPILPAPARDHREFDFTDRINDPSDVITDGTWDIDLMPNSRIKDPDPTARLIGDPIIDQAGQKTSHLLGDMIDGVVYRLTVQVSLTDGRILVARGQLACVADPSQPIRLRNGAVPFNYGLWISRYPEFKTTSQEQAEGFWENACLIFRNDATSPETDPKVRQTLLMCLTSHIAAQFGGPQGGGGYGPQITGPINSKSVGSVSLSGSPFPGVNGTSAWYMTTRYGAEFWKKTAAYRAFHYVVGPTRFPPYSWSPGSWNAGRWIW